MSQDVLSLCENFWGNFNSIEDNNSSVVNVGGSYYWYPTYPDYQPYYSYWPSTYVIERDKMKQAIAVVKVLLDKKLIKDKVEVKEFLDLVNEIYKAL